ncbi:MAG: hypothetical protein OEV64_14565 [Desulfobulbaceae bacterium]|nr:hypothetical protein [Desulfobulbaceae bacterium]
MQLMNRVNLVLRVTAVVSCSFFMVSCVATQALHDALTGQRSSFPPNHPINGPGMMLYSPDENGWYRVPSQQNQFAIVKPGHVHGETYAFMVDTLTLEASESRADFITKLQRGITENSSTRYTNIKVTVDEYPKGPGGNCLVRHWSWEDHAPPGLEGKETMTLESVDFVCINPNDKTTAAFLSYSQRYFLGGRDPRLMEKAAGYIQKLTFKNEYQLLQH